MPNDIQSPGYPTPANTPLGNLPGWVTTLLGALVAVGIYLSGVIPEPWGSIVATIAGALGMLIGYSHPGTRK